MNRYRFLYWAAVFWGIAVLWTRYVAPLFAEETAGNDKGMKKYGIVHNIAEDRRLEKVGGLYEPEGLDIYMKRHMDGLEEKMNGVEGKVEEMREKLEEVSGLIKTMAEKSKEGEKETSRTSRVGRPDQAVPGHPPGNRKK